MIQVAPRNRDRIADCAAGFTSDPDDTQALLANARPLLEWAGKAGDEEDLDTRISTMEEQGRRNKHRNVVPDTSEAFLKDVRDAYEFATGNSS